MFHQRGRWRGRERGVETHSFRINRGLGKSSKADEVGRANAREILPAIFNGSSRRKAIRSHPSFASPPFQRNALTSLDLGCGQAADFAPPPHDRPCLPFFHGSRSFCDEAWLRGRVLQLAADSNRISSIKRILLSSTLVRSFLHYPYYYYRRKFFVEKLSNAITR